MTLPIWTGTVAAPADRAAGWAAGPGSGRWLDGVLAPWYEVAARHVRRVPRADAAIAVLPWSVEAPWEVAGRGDLAVAAERFVADARAAGLVTVAFCRSDSMNPAPAGCVVLRTSIEARARGPLDVPAPPWIADPATHVDLRPRAYVPRPSVAFVGQARPLGAGAGAYARYAIRCAVTAVGSVERLERHGKAAARPDRPWSVGWVRAARAVDARVVVRDELVSPDLAEPDAASYLRAIGSADYGLAVRGYGNYSFRLYEVLASARPALLCESGAPLPRARDVDWDRIAVRVPWVAAPAAGRRLAARHAALGPERWQALQDECRRSWLEHLSPRGFLTTTAAALAALGPAIRDPEAVAAALR